jgi:arabinofuranosyltransferase
VLVAAKYWPHVAIAVLVFPAWILYGRHIYAPCDDAYIYLVYARNFIDGNGLTFNGTIVEGFTSPVWVMLLSTLGLAGIPLPLLAATLSTLAGLLALFATYMLARQLNLDPGRALIAPILLVATGDFTFHMGVGLEETLFAALVALSVALAYLQDPCRILRSYRFPLLMGLIILTRPEGVLVSALVLVMLGVRSKSVLLSIRCGTVLAVILAPVVVSKWLYYGYPLPNTYYVKSNARLSNLGQGIAYLSRSV